MLWLHNIQSDVRTLLKLVHCQQVNSTVTLFHPNGWYSRLNIPNHSHIFILTKTSVAVIVWLQLHHSCYRYRNKQFIQLQMWNTAEKQNSNVLKSFQSLISHRATLISVSCSPQLDSSRSRKTTDTGLVYRVVCPFTPQLSLVLINRPHRDVKLSWRWYTPALS